MGDCETSDNGFYSYSSKTARELTEDDKEKLAKQTVVSDFKKKKLEIEAQKNWDKFYNRNKDNFFKDRHWSLEDLKEICPDVNLNEALVYLEAGCGVGNMLFPLAQELPNLKLLAFDFSKNAVNLLRNRADDLKMHVETDVVDLSIESVESTFSQTADLATLIFVLSAIHPDKHRIAINNMKKYLKLNGTIVIRDYAINDYAMIRFGRDTRIADRFYVRQDGTRAYYFQIDELVELFESCGFRCDSSEYLHRITINHKKGVKVPRIFVQARFTRVS